MNICPLFRLSLYRAVPEFWLLGLPAGVRGNPPAAEVPGPSPPAAGRVERPSHTATAADDPDEHVWRRRRRRGVRTELPASPADCGPATTAAAVRRWGSGRWWLPAAAGSAAGYTTAAAAAATWLPAEHWLRCVWVCVCMTECATVCVTVCVHSFMDQ